MKENRPFKFLDAYQKEDYQVFFGREKETERLYAALSGVKHLLVYGPSGAGKTSLIECGLRNQFSDADWFALSIRKGYNINASVFTRIEEALEGKIVIDSNSKLPEDKNNLFGQAVQQLFEERFQPLYLLFDQFEELFILGNEEEQKAFFKNLNKLISYKIPCRILLIMREEFIGCLSEFENLCPTIFKHRFRVEKMRKNKVGEMIEKSLEAPTYNCFYTLSDSKALAKKILNKLPDEKREIELTHVQVFLNELWERANEKTSDNEIPTLFPELVEDNDNLKGVLNSFLIKQVGELDMEYGKSYAMKILVAMISEKNTKQQVTEHAINKDLPDKAIQLKQKLPDLLRDLRKRRLIRTQRAGEQIQYEISHDLLALAVGKNLPEEIKRQKKAEETFKFYDAILFTHLTREDINRIKSLDEYESCPESLKDKIKDSELKLQEKEDGEDRTTKRLYRTLQILSIATLITFLGAVLQYNIADKAQQRELESKTNEEKVIKVKEYVNNLLKKEKENIGLARDSLNLKILETDSIGIIVESEIRKRINLSNKNEKLDSIVERQKIEADRQSKLTDEIVFIAENQVMLTRKAKRDVDSVLTKIKNEQYKNEKIIDAFYFYEEQYALAYKDGKYGIVKKGDESPIDYIYTSAEQFDTTGYAKVKIKKRNNTIDYLLDTTGKEIKVAYNVENLDNSTEALDLRSDISTDFPVEIFKNKQLQTIMLGSNMNSLDLSGGDVNKLSSLPVRLEEFNNLRILDLSNNELSDLPEVFGNLENLIALNLSNNKLDSLRDSFGQLDILKNLNLSNNDLSELQGSFGQLDSLKNLNLSNNKLSKLPDAFGQLNGLKNLNLSNNLFSTLPESIAQLKNLTELSLNGNQLNRLPESIGGLKKLEYLNLSDNKKLRSLPPEVVQLNNLVLLDLNNTHIGGFKVRQLIKQLPNCTIKW